MRALTLTQPWAGLVANGHKLVENRPRHMIKRDAIGARFAIHASREVAEPTFDRIFELAPDLRVPILAWHRTARITSAVIAVATLASIVDARCGSTGVDDDGHCKRCGLRVLLSDLDAVDPPQCPPGFLDIDDDQRRWFFGPIGYVLRDVRVLEPVPCRGWQGFWTLPDDIAERVEAQLR